MEEKPVIHEIVLRDLQPVLRQKLGDKLIVESFDTKPLLPPGENYGSMILSVHAVIRKNEDKEKEDLYLIAKMVPPTDFQRLVFDSSYTFKKEIFMYETILPSYNQLERECGLNEDELFDVVAKFYGSRLSSDPNVEFDDNAVILLENLKVRGYYTGARNEGYDLEHSKLAVRAMARFHALGMATKYKKPELFEIFRHRAKSVEFKSNDFDNIHVGFLQKIKEDPELAQYYDKCSQEFTPEKMLITWTAVPEEPWSTIVHSDFWVNNVMFHRDENGRVDDVKFVDFQNYLFFSPMRELVFYVFSSVEPEIVEQHVEELFDLYYDTLISVLTKLGCDVTPLSRENFDAQIPHDARMEFMHVCFMLKVLTLNVKETDFDYDKIKNVMVTYQGNQAYMVRLRQIVSYFAKHNWI